MYKILKAQELREVLSARGLDTSGTRPALIARLQKDDDDDEDKEGKTNKKRNSASDKATDVLLEADDEKKKSKKSRNCAADEICLSSIAQSSEDELEEKAYKKRNSGARKNPPAADGKKAKITSQDLGIKPLEVEEMMKIDDFTAVELRSALENRGLSTVGTKKTLYNRLSEALNDQGKYVTDEFPSVYMEKKAEISERVKETKCLDLHEVKDIDEFTGPLEVEEMMKIDEFTAVELRSALENRGLSTVGTKKTLYNRLSEALNDQGKYVTDEFPSVYMEKKAEISERVKETKCLDLHEVKDIDEFTVVELRTALDKRELSTVGNKKALYNRLLQGLMARKIVNEGGSPASKGNKVQILNQDPQIKSPDNYKSKKVDGPNVAELRAALDKQGVSAVGTENTLYARLLGDLKGGGMTVVDGVSNEKKPDIVDQVLDTQNVSNDEMKAINGLTVAELRDALYKRGLSTVGTKNTLHDRLSKDLNAGKMTVTAKAPYSNQDTFSDQNSETKYVDNDDIKEIGDFTLAELRAALGKRGLSVVGTKKTLYDRLIEDLSAGRTNVMDKFPKGNRCNTEDHGSETKSKDNNEIKEIDEFTVGELRAALRKRGLSMVGAKKTLFDRISQDIKAGKMIVTDEVPNVNKDKNSDPDFETKSADNNIKDIDSFSVTELRAILDERKLSTVGTKKALYHRLVAHDKARETQDELKENKIKYEDAKGSDGVNYEKEKNIVTVTKKGRAVLDVHLPDNVKSRYHVLGKGTDIYDAMLNQTNVDGNNNKFYVIQALEPDSGCGDYLVYNRWGRVGVKGQDKLFNCSSKAQAIMEFESKFYDKTHNDWASRHNFKPERNKYTWLERDYTDGTEGSDSNIEKTEGKQKSVVKSPFESKLDSRLAQFISYICNIDMMRQQMLQIGYDATQLPLGKLSKTTILKGYECLKKIAAVLDNTAQGSIEQLSSEFYTVIPHDFGFQKMRNFIIDTPQKLKRKLEMVEALGEIQLATTLLHDVKEEDDPIYSHYKQLNCYLEPLQHDSEEFHWINCYLHNTHAQTHSQYELEIIEVFRAKRDIEQENFKRFTSVKNRMLLWHGSRLTNWTGILSQGLRIAPPEAPVTGYMFGKGVYFADMVSKSANYCYTSRTDSVGVLLLCEVALGDMWELQTANYNADQLPPGKLSTKGVGGTEPNPKEAKVLPDGVVVPLGKPVKKKGDTGSLLYNEYIVYDVSQIQMRYVLQVKFKYR